MWGEIMKKSILIFVLIFVFGVVSGCEKTEVKTKQTNTDTASEYITEYEDVLANVYAFIENIDNEIGPAEGFDGIWEAAIVLGDEALNEIGYVLKDITGDNIPELLIGVFEKADDAYTNNEIYLLYTLREGSPEIVLYGWNRNAYALKDDNSFFYQGSSGAAQSAFGKYHVSKDGETVCDDFYFTYPNDDNPEKIEIYHNTTGVFYHEGAEKVNMTLDEFWELEEEMSKRTARIKCTPFSELDENIIEKATFRRETPNPKFLDGEWVLSATEVEGEKLTAEECGFKSEITIVNDTAQYFITTDYETKRFKANIEFLEEPLYYNCSNDKWCLKFDTVSSDFSEDEEFYATLIDENTLLVRFLFPFDGAQGVSHQTYTRK